MLKQCLLDLPRGSATRTAGPHNAAPGPDWPVPDRSRPGVVQGSKRRRYPLSQPPDRVSSSKSDADFSFPEEPVEVMAHLL
jgi:hypothetical protein